MQEVESNAPNCHSEIEVDGHMDSVSAEGILLEAHIEEFIDTDFPAVAHKEDELPCMESSSKEMSLCVSYYKV